MNETNKKDAGFEEEEQALADVEQKIDAEAEKYEREWEKLRCEIDGYFTLDSEDVRRKQELIEKKNKKNQDAAELRAYQPSPYYGRLDLEETGKSADGRIHTYYIGKKGLNINGRELITDWRSEVGGLMAMNQKELDVAETHYFLMLKRNLEIQNAKLIECMTQYDGSQVTLEGELIDPFLLTVLKDKRRQHRLTDIIRSIQANQNLLIRRPKEECFVVQGCAGSGKTMIMLHRLSYLKFNDRDMAFAGTKIITPNPLFDQHIDELSRELGLDEIERYSVEEYDVELIRRYSRKINVSAEVSSEKNLNEALLAEMYTPAYMDEMAQYYHAFWNQKTEEMDEIFRLFERSHMSIPDISVHKQKTAELLMDGLTALERQGRMEDQQKKEKRLRLEQAERELQKKQADAAQKGEELHQQYVQARANVNRERESAHFRLKEVLAWQRENTDARQTLQNDVEYARRFLDEKRSQFEVAQRFFAGKRDEQEIELTLKRVDSIAKISKQIEQLRKPLDEAEKLFRETPVYNFGKRNRERADVEREKKRYTEATEKLVSAYLSKEKEQLAGLEQTVKDAENELRALQQKEVDFKMEKEQLQEEIAVLEATDAALEGRIVSGQAKPSAELLRNVQEKRGELGEAKKKTAELAAICNRLSDELAQLEKTALTEAERALIQTGLEKARQLSFDALYEQVIVSELVKTYRLYGETYSRENYRHKLIYTLLLCTLYFDPPSVRDAFLHIDEAQDISVSEYRLWRSIVGERCIFNLYGDVNQAVYSCKGISNWEEIREITAGHVYQLNENYRNTVQITEFCNAEFGAEVTPIGVSGEVVHEWDLRQAVSWILEKKQEKPEARAAVLIRYDQKNALKQLKVMLEKQDAAWFEADDTRISVLSVEKAKGLEFEYVVTLTDGMSLNERYVAYTRALEALAIVRDTGLGTDEKYGLPREEHKMTAPTAEQTVWLDALCEALGRCRQDFSEENLNQLQSLMKEME